jgi:hypothetical protein
MRPSAELQPQPGCVPTDDAVADGVRISGPPTVSRGCGSGSEGVRTEEIALRFSTTRNAVYDALNRWGR